MHVGSFWTVRLTGLALSILHVWRILSHRLVYIVGHVDTTILRFACYGAEVWLRLHIIFFRLNLGEGTSSLVTVILTNH